MDNHLKENRIYFGLAPKYENTPRIKIFPTDTYEIIPDNILPSVGTTRSAQTELDKILGKRTNEKGKLVTKFDNPKPHELIEHLISISNSTDSITILDFFAGSGTTGHAVMKLNAEDGGNRKFILCTNNENNICRDVTYERIKRVIDKEGYEASLKYYKVDFVPMSDRVYYEYADELLAHVKELVELENAINFNGNAEIAIVLTDEELGEFVESEAVKSCKTLYLGHDVAPDDRAMDILQRYGVTVNIIPDYYYSEMEG